MCAIESPRTRSTRRRPFAIFTAIVALVGLAAGCAHPGIDEASYGTPSAGYMVHPHRLADRGRGYEVLRTRSQGGQHFGTARLIALIEHAAAIVQREAPGSVSLRVGDLSGPFGGQIPHHRSHRSGRDADLLFFALDASGRPTPTPTFVRYDAQGNSLDPEHPLRFDVHRNWLLASALAHDVDAGVVWIFCADRLRTLLLEHGRTLGTDDETLARVAELLHQPGDSAPHDDHFHVRVACTGEERARGCRDGGALGWWLEHRYGKADAAPLDDDAVIALLTEQPWSVPSSSPRTMAAESVGLRGGRPTPRTLRAPLAAVANSRTHDAL